MARTTIKDLELRIEKLEKLIEKLIKKMKYIRYPYEEKPKKCPCCGQRINPYKNIYDNVKWEQEGHFDRRYDE
jgi:redox-regulated HSP33 family molecular chaperone